MEPLPDARSARRPWPGDLASHTPGDRSHSCLLGVEVDLVDVVGRPALVLPHHVDGRPRVAVTVPGDVTPGADVVDALAGPERRDRLRELLPRVLLTGRARDRAEVLLDHVRAG